MGWWKKPENVFLVVLPLFVFLILPILGYRCLIMDINRDAPELIDFELLAFFAFIPSVCLLFIPSTMRQRYWSIDENGNSKELKKVIFIISGLWSFMLVFLILLIMQYAYIYRIYGLRDTVAGKIVHESGTSLYFSIVTWTTLGYGAVLPTEGAARALAACEALNGYFSMGVLIGSLVMQFDALIRPLQSSRA